MKNKKSISNKKKESTKNKKQKGGVLLPGDNIFIASVDLVNGMVGLGEAMAIEVDSIMQLPRQLNNAANTVPGQPNVTTQPEHPRKFHFRRSHILKGPVPPPQSS